MIEHLYSSTLFAVIAAAAAFCLRRYSARYRYAILLLAVLRFAVPTGMLAAAGRALAATAAAPPVLGEVTRVLLRFSATPLIAPPPSPAGFPVLLALWLAGSILSLGLWLRHAFDHVEYALACSKLEADALQRAQLRMGVTGHVDLRIGAAGQTPGVRGLWRSCIVLPGDLAAKLEPSELEAVLAHELAHIRRRDNLLAAAVRLVVSIFWFHPLLWWLERRLLIERELACDEQVLAGGAAASDYLSGILKVCRMSYAGAHGYAGATGSNLKQRMEQIMSTNLTNPSSTPARAAIGSLLAIGVLAPLAAGFLAAQQTAGVQLPPGAAITSAVVQGVSGVDHSKAMLALSRLYKAPLVVRNPADTGYSRWLTQDVAYIVTQEEASAFQNLTTNQEREKFIEQFWLRRDPTTGGAPDGKVLKEHYRRIAYANERFFISGPPPVPGWESARGRTYILLGPPDEIEQHPGWQAWLYRNFDHSSDSLILTFQTP
jgi:GWxTD domain-containing protein